MERNALLRNIWGLARELGIGSEELHMILSRETGKDSMRQSSDKELRRLLEALKLYKTAEALHKNGVTDKQMRYIRDLERKLGWHGDPSRLCGFVKKYAKVDNPEWLTVKKAGQIIEGLKGLYSREKESGAVHRNGGGVDAAICEP